MSKDPAFLFYSKDYYEGTRMMLPEERACYVDLMIYQHQNGIIPNDLKRVLMYCSGTDEATLKATLEAKFKQTEKGWFNEKLNKVVLERSEYTNKQSINGKIGQFWKKCKSFLTAKEYKELRKSLEKISNTEIYDFLKDKEIDKATLKATLEALLQHLVIEDVIVNEDKIKDESKKKKAEIIYPFNSKNFIAQWDLWKKYKKKEFGFNYKSEISEQAALKKLSELSEMNEKVAIAIIHQSITNSWKGLFNLKTNAKSSSNTGNPTINRQTRETIISNSEGWEVN